MFALQSYKRRWRYYKIMQMFEKLALLCIALYIPRSESRWVRLAAASAVMGLSWIVITATRPLHDILEALMDIVSRYGRIGVFFTSFVSDAPPPTPPPQVGSWCR